MLERELKRARGNQKEFIGKIAETFKGALKKARSRAGVEGREKHLYSIYKKMQTQEASRSTRWWMCTAFASSSTAPTPATARSGLVHGVYKPMPGRFKDYIAIPRVNGYQSLHTTLFGPNGMPIEVQIRSEQMHRVAESGIAAHWKYKSGGDTFGGVEHDRAREWLASLVQIQEGGSSEEFLESVKVDLFPDKVYVFTPKGKILRLPTRRHGGGFRLCHPYRRRQSLRRRQGRSAPGAAAHAAAQRPDRRNHHRQGRHPESVLVDLPGDGEGARGDPRLSQESEARRGTGTRHAACSAWRSRSSRSI